MRTLTDAGDRRGSWWGDPRGKLALEALHHRGELAVHDRLPGFVTAYDLTERVIPDRHRLAPIPPRPVALRQLLGRTARAHPAATIDELADHHRLRGPEVRPVVAAMVADRGDLAGPLHHALP